MASVNQGLQQRDAGAVRGRSRRVILFTLLAVVAIIAAGMAGYLLHKQPSQETSRIVIGDGERAVAPVVNGELFPPANENDKAVTLSQQSATPAARRPGMPTSAPPLRWPLWESQLRQPIPPRDPPLTPTGWRIVGAAANGGSWKLIIQRQGKATPEFYGTGDSLPGGYVVGTITEEDVTLLRGKRAIVLSYIGT